MTGRTKVFCLILAVIAVVWVHGLLSEPDTDTSFHLNGTVASLGGVVCPDSPHARAGLSDKRWDETIEDMRKTVQAGEPLRAPDLTGENCQTLDPGTSVYIESTDSKKIATVTVMLPDKTTIHGITRLDMVREGK